MLTLDFYRTLVAASLVLLLGRKVVGWVPRQLLSPTCRRLPTASVHPIWPS